MKRFFCVLLLLFGFFCFLDFCSAGPVRRLLGSVPIVRKIVRPEYRSYLIGHGRSSCCDSAVLLVPEHVCPSVETQLSLPPPSTALEPRPGTGSSSLPGKSPPTGESSLLPKLAPGLPDPGAIAAPLQSLAGKLDTLLLWLQGGILTYAAAKSLPWVAPVVRGLHVFFTVVSQLPTTSVPGQPQVAGPVNPAVVSSTSSQAGS